MCSASTKLKLQLNSCKFGCHDFSESKKRYLFWSKHVNPCRRSQFSPTFVRLMSVGIRELSLGAMVFEGVKSGELRVVEEVGVGVRSGCRAQPTTLRREWSRAIYL